MSKRIVFEAAVTSPLAVSFHVTWTVTVLRFNPRGPWPEESDSQRDGPCDVLKVGTQQQRAPLGAISICHHVG